MTTTPKSGRGFTLIELIITVTIIIILASIAVPSYRNHVKRSNRSDAMAALTRIAAAQEKFYLQNNTYTGSLGADGLDLEFRADLGERYDVAITAADRNSFVARATAVNHQADDTDCSVFQLDEQGRRYAEDDGSAASTEKCWR